MAANVESARPRLCLSARLDANSGKADPRSRVVYMKGNAHAQKVLKKNTHTHTHT